ncbi:glycosyltransferase family 2 protein [Christiangramia fulva]|uniref:Glycosyltransferase family 2 protein n=1 Tax=Christiangramia fulva TaxID=2126553 RepID=A0A2R3Z0Q9_9FLAO|nr:glycosyltransferase family 2 protein [Christiangramia fulva]AVR43836.1 glycosyltransferase family 2 protein [Christiangramia fulva]
MKENKKPKISIIVATFNRAHFIEESLKYIVQQTFANFECLIIDDGSTDNTAEIAIKLSKIDYRFKYFRRNKSYKKGISGCRNHGLDMAKGEYIIFFDDDDIVHPDNLKICLSLIKEFNVDFCRYDKEPFSGEWDPKIIKKNSKFKIERVDFHQIEEVITGKIAFASCCILWKKDCFQTIRFNEELQYAEEWECYSRILTSGYSGISIDKVLYYNRKHFQSNTGEFRDNKPIRMESKIKAIKLVIDNLKTNNLLSPELVKYFIRWGFQFNKPEIIRYGLKQSEAGILKFLNYEIGFLFYPILKPLFRIKGILLDKKHG